MYDAAMTARRRGWPATVRRWWPVALVLAGFATAIVLALVFGRDDSVSDDAALDDPTEDDGMDPAMDPAQPHVQFGIKQDCQQWRVPGTGSAIVLCSDGM
jgi:hypothetical protein